MRFLILMISGLIGTQLIGCSHGRAAQMAPVGSPTPIQVGQTTHPIAFARLIVRVPAGTAIGHHHDGLAKVRQFAHVWHANMSVASDDFGLIAVEILQEQGYYVLGGGGSVFRRDESSKARFQLGGTVNEFAYDTYGRLAGHYEEAVLGVTWELFDALRDSVVHRSHTRGHATRQIGQGAAVQPAFADALRRLLSDRAFVAIVTEGAEGPSIAATPGEMRVRTCPTPDLVMLPDRMEDAFRSVVVVRPGITLGSGVIISPDGHVLTAAHVVSGLQHVPLLLRSGITVDAEVLAVDGHQDVALLKLPGERHDCLPLSRARAGVGTDLFAIGSPRMPELSYSVSRGVVSGYREINGRQYIQTDASLNPGNSGGPLLTRAGQVAGVVSWKIVTPSTEGLAFGVPVDVIVNGFRLIFD